MEIECLEIDGSQRRRGKIGLAIIEIVGINWGFSEKNWYGGRPFIYWNIKIIVKDTSQ